MQNHRSSTHHASAVRRTLQSDEWAIVPLANIERALQIYPQQSSQRTSDCWSCGPHATARARVMTDLMQPADFPAYIAGCPRTTEQFKLLGFIDVGNTATGPLPSVLARYSGGSHITLPNSAGSMLPHIISQHIQRSQRPVVVLIAKGLLLHYVTVVAYSRNTQHFAYLDTNNHLYEWSAEELTNNTATVFGTNLITF